MTTLAPISVASSVIGFVSFAFTLLIWLHASWAAFQTLGSAPREVQDTFSTLRQGLYEEREYLKRTRRSHSTSNHHSQSHSKTPLYSSGGPTRIINDAVKDLIHEFKSYEAPFLEAPPIHRGREEKELEWSFDAAQRYYKCDLAHRVLWLRVKGKVESIAVRLQRVQTRRIAVEVTESHFVVKDTMGLVRGYGERLRAIEERLQMSRIG